MISKLYLRGAGMFGGAKLLENVEIESFDADKEGIYNLTKTDMLRLKREGEKDIIAPVSAVYFELEPGASV